MTIPFRVGWIGWTGACVFMVCVRKREGKENRTRRAHFQSTIMLIPKIGGQLFCVHFIMVCFDGCERLFSILNLIWFSAFQKFAFEMKQNNRVIRIGLKWKWKRTKHTHIRSFVQILSQPMCRTQMHRSVQITHSSAYDHIIMCHNHCYLSVVLCLCVR